MSAAGERQECDINPSFGAPLLIFSRGYLLKPFSQGDTYAKQRGFETTVFPHLGEIPTAIKPRLPVCLL